MDKIIVDFKCKKTPVKHKGEEYTVLIADYDFKYTYIVELHKNDFFIFSTKEELLELSAAFYAVAQTQNAILFIPCRNNNNPLLSWGGPSTPIGLDLVCISHTLQLKQKEWKSIREKIKNYSLANYNIVTNTNQFKQKEWEHFNYKENKDIIDLYSNFSTLILTGSKETFCNMGYWAMDLSYMKYDKNGLAHKHLSHLFKWTDKYKEWREVTFYLLEPLISSETDI
ncbi:MAG: hypothetical protein JXN65_01360 [Clostridia bacterium]|nr:hypothetical protein [Clostridia bacterium]